MGAWLSCQQRGPHAGGPLGATYDELGVHLGRHEDQTLVLLQVWVVVEDQLTGCVLSQGLLTNRKMRRNRNALLHETCLYLDVDEGGEVQLVF